MPKSVHAAGCVRNALNYKYFSECVWISDDLLSDVFRRFTSRQRRYGSNVPGPLEARRRAAKRRNTSLAHHDFGMPVLDPSVVLRSATSNPGWQTLPAQAIDTSPRLLPSWLFQPPQKTLPNIAARLGRIQGLGPLENTSEQSYMKQLEKCTELKSIQTLIESLQLNLRSMPHLAEKAFQHMTKLYWSQPTAFNPALFEFLSDPELHPPGSQNHLVFLQQLEGRRISRKTWDDFILPAYQKAISLGLVSIDDLQKIILGLPHYLQSSSLDSELENGLPLSDWHRILTSVYECQVLSINDLGEDFVAKWLQLLGKVDPVPKVTELLWRLREMVNPSDPEFFVILLLARLRYSGNEDSVFQAIETSIRALSAEDRWSAILAASQRLVAALLRDHVSSTEVDLWHRVLARLSPQTCGIGKIDRQTWRSLCAATTALSPAQTLAIIAWTIASFSRGHSKTSIDFSASEVRNQLRKIWQSENLQSESDKLGKMITTLDMLPLPGKDRLYQCLSPVFDANLVSLIELKDYKKAIQKSISNDLRIFDDDDFHHWTMQNSRQELTKIAERVTDDLSALNDLCQLLIMNDKKRLKIVRRILEHSMTMKIRASFWPRPRSSREAAGNQLGMDSPLKANEAVDFVHRLALSIAISPVLEPRSAFRNVQYLYNWLQRYGAPILPSMSRALWHTGVSRYGHNRCPVSQLKWCLDKVEEIEGSEVKEMLLTNKGQEQRWAAEMERIKAHLVESNARMTRLIIEGRQTLGTGQDRISISADKGKRRSFAKAR